MNIIQCGQIETYNLPGNEFGYNRKKTNPHMSIFACLPVYASWT